MKTARKESKTKGGFRTTSIIIAVVMLVGAFGVLIGPFTVNTSATFFDGHAYYTDLHVVGTPSGDQTNYQVRHIVYSGVGTNLPNATYLGGHALNWPYDIRFTKADSTTPLDFWRESYDANNMTVWVELDSIPAYPASTDFYIHYGKAAEADASSGNNTFAFFDDFLGVALEAQWAESQSVTVSAGAAHLTVATNDVTTESYILSTATFGMNKSFEARFKPLLTNDRARLSLAAQRCGLTVNEPYNFIGELYHVNDYTYTIVNTVGSNNPQQTTRTFYAAAWQLLTINWTLDKTVFLKDRATVWGTETNNVPTGTDLKMYLRDQMDVDWVLLRNHQDIGPTWGAAGTENSGVPLITSVGPTDGYLNVAYSYNATCMIAGVNGTINWQLLTNATWLSKQSNGTGYQVIAGVVNVVGSFYVNVSVNDTDSSDYENYTVVTKDWQAWTDLMSKLNFTRSASNPLMIPTTTWEGINIGDFPIIEEANELRMYYSGFGAGVKNGIGLATSPKDYPPTNWTKYGEVFAPNDTAAQWDTGYIRIGNIFKVDATYYLYYQGGPNIGGTGTMGFGLATSTDGISFTRSVYNPILTISGTETQIEDPAVVRVSATEWYMYYCYRTAALILPGIRVANSSDGISWTKIAGDVVSKGATGTWDAKYIEHAQPYFIGGHYVLIYEAVGDLIGKPWSHGLAYSESPTGAFTKYAGNPFFTSSGVTGAFDQYHVATPYLFNHDGIWYLFFQGGNVSVPYGNSFWSMGMAYSSYPVSDEPPVTPSIPRSLQASFSYSIDGNLITFTDKSYGPITVWIWNFGDGTGSTKQNPAHKYAVAGKYTMSLTVYDEDAHSSIAQTTITISYGPENPLERGPEGWKVHLTPDFALSFSAIGLLVGGAIMYVSAIYMPYFPVITQKGRKVIGALMFLGGLYFLIFVKGVQFP